ncbi:hypothetical protein AB1Y20_015738 [Prymnesium parvum]|uniref:Obg family GTPase CgtA n=1 Tax=Prymnesium parvum TaxID=97485 RepID=A0AB34K1A7_PRYPA
MRSRCLSSAAAPGARKFIDRVRVLAVGGPGGQGCASFFRDTRVQRGPPDGGSGGRGGNVIVRSSESVTDLALSKRNFMAGSGGNGTSADMDGRTGHDLEVMVPNGTLIQRVGKVRFSRNSQMEPPQSQLTLVAELLRSGDAVVVAAGGAGGRGNKVFKTGKLQNTSLAENGKDGEAVTLLLSLKLIADVGLVGFPNAGKSSLLAALSNARPRIADYPFTTLHPYLGNVMVTPLRSFIVADIPGLVSGAHANVGLGHAFLRHIERTSVLCYVLDLSSPQPPFAQLLALQSELELYQPGLSQRPCVLVANKADTPGAAHKLQELRAACAELHAMGQLAGLVPPGEGKSFVTAVSARERKNLHRMVERLDSALHIIVQCDRERLTSTALQESMRHTGSDP